MTARTYRDAYGIPHLRADSVEELAFAQGRNAAFDRAWQLTWAHWRALGRTAEFVGATGIVWDRFAHAAQVAGTGRRAYDRLDARTKTWLEHYAAGVNAGLPAGAEQSDELRRLDRRPLPWDPWTPLAVFHAQHVVFATLGYKLGRRHLRETLGAEAVGLFTIEGNASAGSNAWALTGARTASRLPQIAGDPHRTIEQPGTYQQVRLACDDFDVVGFAFPGVPGIQHFGHAGSVAWAITNAMADYQDLYLETDPPTVVSEVEIAVRGAAGERVQVAETPRGPVIAGLGPGAWLSLRVPSRELADLGFAALLPLLHARTVGDVEAALQHWVEPVNSVLVADTTGEVRHLVAGKVPLRAAANAVEPVPGDAAHDWHGYAPLLSEPVDDSCVNANDRASGGGLGYDYAPPHRAARIRQLLGDRRGLTAADHAAIHLDALHPGSITLRRLLADAPDCPARDALLAWDGRADADSTGMALFAQWRHVLVDWLAEQPQLRPFRGPSGVSHLFDKYLDPDLRIAGAWEHLVAADNPLGLDLPVGVAVALAGVDTDDRRTWADRHRLAPLHGLLGSPYELELADIGLPGDSGCVCAAYSTPGVTDACTFGPVARYVWDLADRQASRWIVPFGASARLDSPHRTDQLSTYAEGVLIGVVTDWHRLTLDPG